MNASGSQSPLEGGFYARTFALATLLVLGLLLYRILQPLFSPMVWSAFIAFILYPLHKWLTRRLGGRASLSAALLTVATVLMLLGPLTGLSAAFAAQVAQLLEFVQGYAAEQTRNGSDPSQMPVLGTVLDWLQNTLGVTAAQIRDWLEQGGKAALQLAATMSGKLFIGALGRVLAFTLAMFMLFFFIRDGRQMLNVVRALVPLAPADRKRLFDHLASVTLAVVYGTGLTALVQGILVGIGFAIAGLPSPLVFGALAAIFALLPAAGTPLVWVPAVVVLAAQGRWIAAIFLLAWGVMVTTVDNVLRPILVSGRADIGTLPVFVGVLGGVSAFGTVGMLLGPLLLALVFALIRFALEGRQLEDPVPVTTDPASTARRAPGDRP